MSAQISEYDRATSPTAPRGTFVCPYCGKKVTRRLSKVKNPNKVFCSNECRGKFTEREKLKENFLEGTDFDIEIASHDVQAVSRHVIRRYLNDSRYTFDELYQECLISVWKYGARANNGKGKPGKFYMAVFDRAIKAFLAKNSYPVEELCIDDVAEIEPFYIQPDGLDIIGAQLLHTIETKASKKKNWAWFADYYIHGKKSSEIAQAYGAEMRDVVCAISYIKRSLLRTYAQ